MEYCEKQHKEYELPDSAGALLDEWLTIYQRELSESLRQVDLTRTNKITYLVEGLDLATIEDRYESGRVASVQETDNWLVEKCKDFLGEKANKLIVFDNGLSHKGDAWTKNEKEMKFNYYNDELYTSLCPDDIADINVIRRTIMKSRCCNYAIGIMTSLPENLLPLSQNLDDNTIQLLINNAEHILSLAFDGEGYIIYTFAKQNRLDPGSSPE